MKICPEYIFQGAFNKLRQVKIKFSIILHSCLFKVFMWKVSQQRKASSKICKLFHSNLPNYQWFVHINCSSFIAKSCMQRLCLELTFKWAHKKWKLYLTYFTFLIHFAAKHAGSLKNLPTCGFTRQSSFSKDGTPDNSDSKYCCAFFSGITCNDYEKFSKPYITDFLWFYNFSFN